jgi:AraC-like DNA-binding protein/quercetin dioxygenase-like cupin family protein
MQSGALFQEHVLSPATEQGAIWAFSRPDQKPAHFHGQLEFVLVLRGRAVERIGKTLHRVHAGQLIWHLPGIEHELVEASSDLDLRVVHLEPDLAVAAGRGAASPSDEALPHAFSGWVPKLGTFAAGRPVVELTQKCHDDLLDCCDTPSFALRDSREAPLRLRAALERAWQATVSDHDDRRETSWVELASCLLLHEPWLDRPAVCRALGVSEGYLSRCFQRELGISFLEQRARVRVVRFVAHVTRDRRSLLDAAFLAGFGSYSQLHRVFTNIVGVGPRPYFSRDARNQRALLVRAAVAHPSSHEHALG